MHILNRTIVVHHHMVFVLIELHPSKLDSLYDVVYQAYSPLHLASHSVSIYNVISNFNILQFTVLLLVGRFSSLLYKFGLNFPRYTHNFKLSQMFNNVQNNFLCHFVSLMILFAYFVFNSCRCCCFCCCWRNFVDENCPFDSIVHSIYSNRFRCVSS